MSELATFYKQRSAAVGQAMWWLDHERDAGESKRRVLRAAVRSILHVFLLVRHIKTLDEAGRGGGEAEEDEEVPPDGSGRTTRFGDDDVGNFFDDLCGHTSVPRVSPKRVDTVVESVDRERDLLRKFLEIGYAWYREFSDRLDVYLGHLERFEKKAAAGEQGGLPTTKRTRYGLFEGGRRNFLRELFAEAAEE